MNWSRLRSRLLRPWTPAEPAPEPRQLEALVDERTRQLRQELDAHKEAEAQLRALNHRLAETERFMRLVTDNIPARLAYWDSERRCLFVNRAGHANWGKNRDDFIGRTSEEIFGQGFVGPNQVYSAAALRGEPQDFEREERTPGGGRAMMWLHYEPDIRDGRVVGFFSLATDVTRLHEAEHRLREINEQLLSALDQAEAASRAKSMFLSNMSHEIRTPMNAIIGLTHLMRRDIADPAQSERLRKVSDAADHLLHIINDILDLAKIESGRLRLESTDFSLDAVLSRVTMLVSHEASDKGLELVIDACRRARPLAWRPDPALAGAAQPARQRDQVHRARRRAAQRRVVEARAPRSDAALRRARHRHRHRARAARRSCSSRFSRPTARRHAALAARGSAWRSPNASPS